MSDSQNTSSQSTEFSEDIFEENQNLKKQLDKKTQQLKAVCQRTRDLLDMIKVEDLHEKKRGVIEEEKNKLQNHLNQLKVFYQKKKLQRENSTLILSRDQQSVELEEIARRLMKGVISKDRFWHMKFYKDCFIASEAVDYLVRVLNLTRVNAVQICLNLQEKGWITHVLENEKVFGDKHLFFSWTKKAREVVGQHLQTSIQPALSVKELCQAMPEELRARLPQRPRSVHLRTVFADVDTYSPVAEQSVTFKPGIETQEIYAYILAQGNPNRIILRMDGFILYFYQLKYQSYSVEDNTK